MVDRLPNQQAAESDMPPTRHQGLLNFLALSSDKYPPFRVDTTVLFGDQLATQGHRFDWIMQSEEDCRTAYVADWNGSTVWVGPTDNGGTPFRRVRKHVLWLTHQLIVMWKTRSTPHDFVLVKNKYVIALPALLYARWRKIKFIFWLSYPHAEGGLAKFKEGTARYPWFYWVRAHTLAFLLYRLVLPRADHVFVQSEQMRRDMTHKGLIPEKMTPVPMGVSIQDFDRYRAQSDATLFDLEIWRSRHNIVYLGTLQSARRMDFLVRVLAEVRKTDQLAFLTLVGDGDDPEDRNIITREAERLGIRDHLHITGFLPRAEAMEYVKAADVCVSPFYPDPILNSTSPTKLVEYWAMGKAVVANDHPEQRVTIAESQGGLCTPYDESAFAAAILKIFGDPDLGARMGESGRHYVERERDYGRIALMVASKLQDTVRASAVG